MQKTRGHSKPREEDEAPEEDVLVEVQPPRAYVNRHRWCLMCEDKHTNRNLLQGHYNPDKKTLCLKWRKFWATNKDPELCKPLPNPQSDAERLNQATLIKILKNKSMPVKNLLMRKETQFLHQKQRGYLLTETPRYGRLKILLKVSPHTIEGHRAPVVFCKAFMTR